MRQMNPYASPYPTDPTFAIIGEGLGRALFGDPAARQAQQQAEAERQVALARAEQARSAAGYDDARTRGVGIQNDASSNLVKLLTEGFAAPPPVQDMSTGGSLADVISSLGEGAGREEQGILPPAPVVAPSADERLRSLAPVLFGTMAQMQGDKIDPNGVIGGLAALLGSDEFARRGLVAQGKTPDADFALTPERADDIRAQGYGADYRKSTDVARINHSNDIPVAEIRARGTVDAAGVRATASGNVRGDKDYAKATDDARAAAQRLYPQARITQVERDPNSALGKANPGSYHNHTKGAVDVAPIPGMTFDQYVQGFRNDGYPVLEAKNEVGAGRSAHATGDHWHVVLGRREKPVGKGSTSTSGKPAKAIPVSVSKQIDEKVAALIDDVFAGHTEASRKKVASGWRARAGRYYQRYGDTGQVMDQLRKDMIAANKARAKPSAGGGWGKAAVVGR
jgi:hypothetical protein